MCDSLASKQQCAYRGAVTFPRSEATGEQMQTCRWRVTVVAAVALMAVLAVAAPALAREPRLTVPASKLKAALHCQPQVREAKATPVLLVTGTGFTGQEGWVEAGNGVEAMRAAGHPNCYIDFPNYTTGDVQTSVQYLVHAIRQTRKRAGRDIAVYGISQGGLMPRWALTYWPSLRRMVSDAVLVAGTQHGTTGAAQSSVIAHLCRSSGCPPAFWQQSVNSHLLKALNAQPDETPGRTAYTTVRTLTDDVVQPQEGVYPTSSLQGASNILIQQVCPGRTTGHIASPADSVAVAALEDAIAHKGPARASRLPADVCSQPYAPGLDVTALQQFLDASLGTVATRLLNGTYPLVKREPPVRPYARLSGRTGPN